jgi:FKBP-type peptidyl-prolyl cis-trans isomerase
MLISRSIFTITAALALLLTACNPAAKKKDGEVKAAEGDKAAEGEKAAEGAGEAKSSSPDAIPAPPDVAAPPADAEKTASGLASKVIKQGTGDTKPHEYDKVKVHYTGWTTDGKMFDSSIKRGRPATFGVTGVIPGWTEALQLMTVGEQRRLWIPEILAYKGRPGSPQGMLVFDVELLEIIPGVAPIPAPEDVAAPPADAKKTKSGIAYKEIEPATEKKSPKEWDHVEVEYTGWTTDGKMFDSSSKRGQSARFPLNRVIPGWTEGVQLMSIGQKMRFWIPEELAYKGRPGAPQGMLVFEIKLLSIDEKPEPPKAPKDVAAPPKNAKKTESGLSYKVLKKGTGKAHPSATDKVEVHYTGWTTDGKMFDSSVTRGKPTTFSVNRVIPGWTEGVQLMKEGDKFLFWIPEELAYKGRPGAPQGMLVFEVELLKIVETPPTAAPATPASPHGNPHASAPAAAKPAKPAAAAAKPAEAKPAEATKPAEAAKPADSTGSGQ